MYLCALFDGNGMDLECCFNINILMGPEITKSG